MKTQIKNVSMILMLSLLLNSTSYAVSKSDKFICRAACMAIDPANNQTYYLGSKSGSSEVDEDEAFEDMARNCKMAIREEGAIPLTNSIQIHLVKNVIKVSKKTQQRESRTQASSKGFKVGFIVNFSKIKSTHESYEKEAETEFEYEITPADYDSCKAHEVNKAGRVKYLGSENPLG